MNSGVKDEVDERLQVLETKVGFQDRTIDALDDVVRKQQDQIEELQQEFLKLRDAFLVSSPQGVASDQESPPPDY